MYCININPAPEKILSVENMYIFLSVILTNYAFLPITFFFPLQDTVCFLESVSYMLYGKNFKGDLSKGMENIATPPSTHVVVVFVV